MKAVKSGHFVYFQHPSLKYGHLKYSSDVIWALKPPFSTQLTSKENDLPQNIHICEFSKL